MSIKIENTQIFGWEGAIRGARNPMNSWDKSDSMFYDYDCEGYIYYHDVNKNKYDEMDYEARFNETGIYYDRIGPADHKLLMNLCKGGTEEAKWRRMVHVQMDITAPLYWWKEFETYKVGTTSNSCSTMHKIHAKEFDPEDFSCEHLRDILEYDMAVEVDPPVYKGKQEDYHLVLPIDILYDEIKVLNAYREKFLETKDKKYWWQMIQLLPTSYNQRRTIDLNYEVLASQYRQRKEHKLDEWREYCDWIKTLPYFEFITMEENND